MAPMLVFVFLGSVRKASAQPYKKLAAVVKTVFPVISQPSEGTVCLSSTFLFPVQSTDKTSGHSWG